MEIVKQVADYLRLIWNAQWNWYFLWISIIWMIIHIWIYYAPMLYTNMNRLKGAFESEQYRKLYKKTGAGWENLIYGIMEKV